MPSFWSGLWQGAFRTVSCPYCQAKQSITRRPLPFEISCKSCRKPFRVTERGTEVTGKK